MPSSKHLVLPITFFALVLLGVGCGKGAPSSRDTGNGGDAGSVSSDSTPGRTVDEILFGESLEACFDRCEKQRTPRKYCYGCYVSQARIANDDRVCDAALADEQLSNKVSEFQSCIEQISRLKKDHTLCERMLETIPERRNPDDAYEEFARCVAYIAENFPPADSSKCDIITVRHRLIDSRHDSNYYRAMCVRLAE